MGLLVGIGELSLALEAGASVGVPVGEGEASCEPDADAVDDPVGEGVRPALGTDPHATTRTHAAARIVFEILIAGDSTVQSFP